MQEALFDAAAGDKQAAFHIAWAPARRGVNENLLYTRQRGEGDFTEYTFVGGHIAPANNRQGFTLQFFFYNMAGGSGQFRILIQEQHPNGIVFG